VNNAFFVTCLFLFLQVWAGAMLGTALSSLRAEKLSWHLLRSTLIGAVVAFIPFLITVPTWYILNQPLILSVYVSIVLLAIGIPMFVPVKYRDAVFGPRTYWIWLGIGLVPCGVYVLFQKYEMAQAVGVSMLLVSAFALRHGIKQRTWSPHTHASPDDEDTLKKWGDS
jgi:hypothetical protein